MFYNFRCLLAKNYTIFCIKYGYKVRQSDSLNDDSFQMIFHFFGIDYSGFCISLVDHCTNLYLPVPLRISSQ